MIISGHLAIDTITRYYDVIGELAVVIHISHHHALARETHLLEIVKLSLWFLSD